MGKTYCINQMTLNHRTIWSLVFSLFAVDYVAIESFLKSTFLLFFSIIQDKLKMLNWLEQRLPFLFMFSIGFTSFGV